MRAIDGRIGALVHAVDIGLGVLGRALFENGVIHQVLLETAQQRTVHNAGTAKSAARNGTRELLMAIALVQSEAKFLLRLQACPTNSKNRFEFEQSFGELLEQTTQNPSVKFINKTVNYEELWNEGDVFVFPEKYNELSLPLQEARASGMLVMAGDQYPINTWLPAEALIPVDCYETRKLRVNVESAVYQPEVIANCIDEWFDSDIATYSEAGKSWALNHSWSKWRAPYRDFILTGNQKPETTGILL